MIFRRKILLFACALAPWIASGQEADLDADISVHSRELDRLRGEIEAVERKIQETSSRQKGALDRVHELDQQITLMQSMIRQLKKEERSKRRGVEQAREAIGEKQSDLAALKSRYSVRVAEAYRKGRLDALEKILRADSWRQSVYRAKYLRVLSAHDRQTGTEIRKTIAEISDRKTYLERALRDVRKMEREREAWRQSLEKGRQDKDRELDQLKKDHRVLTQDLKERKAAAEQLARIISRLEREKASRLAELERRRKEEAVPVLGNFSGLKGRLPWPASGKVISRFGASYNSALKTTTENSGIEIRGTAGDEVRAVSDGIVTTVTYIRGYGNTIIIDHGESFYTVYTHVVDVEVAENEYIAPRQVIARLGDSGSLDGAKLHFEVWGKRQKLNPEEWLRKG